MDRFQGKYRIPSSRANWWDYSCNGEYFVTVCIQDKDCLFGMMDGNRIILSEAGRIAKACWEEIPLHFPFVQLDSFVVMPNHVHGILVINNPAETLHQSVDTFHQINVETLHATSLPTHGPAASDKNEFMSSISPKRGTLSSVVRSYKSAVTRAVHLNYPGFSWQPRYYDSIINDDQLKQKIQDYIRWNPANWKDDQFYRKQ